MRRSRLFLAVISTILVFLWILPEGMLAQDGNQAALVIRYSDQNVQTACVDFSEPEISGLELLQRSGLDLELDVQGLGAAVCRIGQTGCPANDCWCQCKGGGDCIYWSYWLKPGGQWQYSQGGASIYTATDGDIQGWSWGPGAVSQAYSPPDLSFEDVCASTTTVEDATPTATATSLVFVIEDTPTSKLAQSQPTATSTSTPSATPTIQPTATESLPATAVMTSTPFPTSSATAVVAVAEQVTNDTQFVAEPTAAREASASGYPASDEQELQPTATLMPPTSLPVVESSESSMATPEAVIAMAKPERSLPTRQREQETKMRVEVTADQASDLTVVGIDAQVPDLRVQPSTTGEQIIEQEVQSSSTSLYSYLVLGLIVLGLAGWLVILSIRRRNRFISAEE
ncbi:MAG: hypothetical protein ACK2UP_08110 [Candidatus Promineifilaceae bacterium]